MWGYDWYGDPRTVDVHIAQVRKKLGDGVEIRTVRGVGYRLDPGERRAAREASTEPPAQPAARRDGGGRVRRAGPQSARGRCARARQSAANAATDDLQKQAPAVAAELDSFGKQFRNGALNRLTQRQRATADPASRRARVLAISHSSVVTVQPDGTIVEGATGLLGLAANPAAAAAAAALTLPDGVTTGDLDAQKLLAGNQQSGQDGSTVFVAQPLTHGRDDDAGARADPACRHAAARARRWLPDRTGGVALFVAAIVSAYLARRMTRPLAAMQETAGRIADGDLAARVRLRGSYPDDELASLARSINAMADELETARGHERAFLLSVSHDLRTPLTSIKGYAEALADGTVDEPELRVRSARHHRVRGAPPRAPRRRPARPRPPRRTPVLAAPATHRRAPRRG